MISSLQGTVAEVNLNSAIIDVNGFGMLVQATPQTLSGLHAGREARLCTAMVVREDSMTLYGFETSEQRQVFETLIGVSGVGPRLALAVLAVHEPEAIRVAASEGDDKAFSKVPGIGPKGARRIVLELAGKLVPLEDSSQAPAGQSWKPQVLDAMTSLGWSEKDASSAIEQATKNSPEVAAREDVGEILRLTLRMLGQDGSKGSRAAAASKVPAGR